MVLDFMGYEVRWEHVFRKIMNTFLEMKNAVFSFHISKQTSDAKGEGIY